MSHHPACPHCGRSFALRLGYLCACGRHNSRLYRQEHLDPARAARMTERQIAAEYRRAGMAPTAVLASTRGYR